MATVDNAFNHDVLKLSRRWQHPRLLVLLAVLAVGLSLNATVNGGTFGGELHWKGIEFFDEAALTTGGEGAGPALDRAKACGRIQAIVETACGLRQRDRDSEGLRQCMAYELKYTMWSAYGCQ